MNTRVSDIMTAHVITVSPDASLESMRGLFEAEGFHHLVVVERSKVLGVVSDRDLLRHLSPWAGTATASRSDDATLQKRAHQAMSRSLVSIAPESRVIEAVRTMLGSRVSCLPVLDQSGKCVGIVTWRDVLSWTAIHLEDEADTLDRDAA